MLRPWPREAWRGEKDISAGRMLDQQVRLGNAALIDTFLDELSAQGHYAASDNDAIVRAVALLPAARATDLLVRIVRRNAEPHLDACGDLLLHCATAPAVSAFAAEVGAASIDCLPGDPARTPAERDRWSWPKQVTSRFAVDLLTATSRIDDGLATRALEHVLAWPGTYDLDSVVVPVRGDNQGET